MGKPPFPQAVSLTLVEGEEEGREGSVEGRAGGGRGEELGVEVTSEREVGKGADVKRMREVEGMGDEGFEEEGR